ncbi:hypothetical protein F4677DRAFT_249083 [Hypoxylon crocopeplum]|nr:hypothetical protein F4677DRAFT_249083 [Hypoxylon crocopeplum]
MFSIDRSLLPSLTTRRALIVVDPQNEFLSEDGALPVKLPMDLPDRIADLATSFRQSGGDIIWVCSRFEKSRSAQEEQILTSERSVSPRSPDISRGRRRQATPPTTQIQPCECPEAFLTQECSKMPKCVRPGSFGVEMHPTVKGAVGPRDYSLVKTYYSAFKSEQLLRLLRMRLVTELFICGSMTNISIMATAVDAASHGYAITVVDDCCGYHNMMRHRNSIKQISNTTGCDVLTAEEVLASFKPKPKFSRRSSDRLSTSPAGRFSTVRRARGEDDSIASSTSEILSSFENLSLSGERAADTPDPEPPAQSSTLPIQPLVRTIEPSRAGINFSVLRSDDVSPSERYDKPQGKLQDKPRDDESQRGYKTNDAQAQPRGKASPPQSNDIVSQDASDGIQPDKDQKETVSNTDLFNRDETQSSTEASSRSSLENTTETTDTESTVGTPSETPIDKISERSETPPEKTEVDDSSSSSTMASEEIVRPSESEPLCEGDTKIIYDVLPKPLSENIFERIRDEVRWQRMSHQGGAVPRLVAVQGQVEKDGSMPVYRHPADESPPLLAFSPAVLEIKKVVEEVLGHPLNHVLIQFYRDGHDYISEHSDKTLDIAKGSFIANLSLGAERTMMFRTKRQLRNRASPDSTPVGLRRQVERERLPHNSLCKMGLKTNMKWLHSIRQDKRMDREKSEEELAYDGGRISLTFRQIETFLDRDNRLIWGQGATSKIRETANQVVNGQTEHAVKMLQGFGRENQSTEFSWDEYYGKGFDVLHISTAPRLFVSEDPVVNMRIQLMLAEYGISYARGSISPVFYWKEGRQTKDPTAIPEDLPIRFVDNDFAKTVVLGEVAIMLYLDRVYGKREQGGEVSRRELSKEFTRFQQGLTLLEKHRASPDAKTFQAELNIWEAYAGEGDDFIAGPTMTLADYAFWPVLNDIIRVPGQCDFGDGALENLKRYHERIRTRESGRKVLIACASCIRQKPGDAPGVAAASTSASASPSASTSASTSASPPTSSSSSSASTSALSPA